MYHLNYRRRLSALLFTFLTVVYSSALAGPTTSGGGNGKGSTPEEVSRVLVNLQGRASEILSQLAGYHLVEPNKVADPELKEELIKMFGPNGLMSVNLPNDPRSRQFFDLFALMATVELKPLDQGPCVDDKGLDKDASSPYIKGAPICFSKERLARFPSEALGTETLALYFHELSHQFGYTDADGKFQDYIRGRIMMIKPAIKLDWLNRGICSLNNFNKELFCQPLDIASGMLSMLPIKSGLDYSVLSGDEKQALRAVGDTVGNSVDDKSNSVSFEALQLAVERECSPADRSFSATRASAYLKLIDAVMQNQ